MHTQASFPDPETESAPSRRAGSGLRVLGLVLAALVLGALVLLAYRQPELMLNWVNAVLC